MRKIYLELAEQVHFVFDQRANAGGVEKCSVLQITHLIFQLGYKRVFHLNLLLKL